MIVQRLKLLLFTLAYRKSTWFFVFIFFIFMLYGQAIKKKNQEIHDINNRICSLQKEKQSLLKEQKDLIVRINSQSDPAWIERVLMKELGVVPEGKTKVCFTKE
jgi:hypothetical protein